MRLPSAPMQVDEAFVPPSPLPWPHEYLPSYDDHHPGFEMHRDPVDDSLGNLFDKLMSDDIEMAMHDEEADKENAAPPVLVKPDARSSSSKAGFPSPPEFFGKENASCGTTRVSPSAP